MRIFNSLILVSLCALLTFSCSKNNKELGVTEKDPHPSNYTLVAEEPLDELPVFNTTGSKQKTNQIAKRLEKYAPAKEEFTVDPTGISTITCENGTTLKFDPGIFVYADSKLPVREEIIVSVTEYLTTSDILFKGLSTTSNKELIETAGMIYVEASAGGRSCEIKKGEYYNIEIPSVTEKENMELFYGEETDDGINWVLANRGRFLGQDGREYYNYRNRTSDAKFLSEFEGGFEAFYKYLHGQYVFPEGFEEAKIANNIDLRATSYVNFQIDSVGQAFKVYTSEYKQTYADSQLVAAIKYSPCWNVNIKRYESKTMMIPVKMNWVHDPRNIPSKLIAENKPNSKKYSAAYETDRYLMVSAQLGWINCDRFTDPQTPRTNLFVALDSTYDATVRIVFNDINGIINGNRFTGGFEFQNLPGGERATIVALRYNNGQTEIAIQEYLIDGSPIKELVFKPASKEELIKQFEQIGKGGEMASIN